MGIKCVMVAVLCAAVAASGPPAKEGSAKDLLAKQASPKMRCGFQQHHTCAVADGRFSLSARVWVPQEIEAHVGRHDQEEAREQLRGAVGFSLSLC